MPATYLWSALPRCPTAGKVYKELFRSGSTAVLVDASGAGKALGFLQSSPAISVLRSVGADPAVVTAARRA